jgi:hypothetical protein
MDKVNLAIIIIYLIVFTIVIIQFFKTDKELKKIREHAKELQNKSNLLKMINEYNSATNDVVAYVSCQLTALQTQLQQKGILTKEDIKKIDDLQAKNFNKYLEQKKNAKL